MNFSHSTLSFRSLLITVLVAAPGLAQTLVTFTNGTIANANDVNANFNAVRTAAAAAQATANAAATQTSFNALSTTVTSQGNSLNNLTGAITVTAPKVQLDRRLQFPATVANRKVVLFEGADNDHQFLGFGISGFTLRYHVNTSDDSHVFFAGETPTTSTELMRIEGNGRVGIGTNDPQARLHVGGPFVNFAPGAAGSFFNNGAFANFPGNAFGPDSGAAQATGILCTGGNVLVNGSFVAYSDGRIKNIVGRSDTGEDLAILNGIEISDYTYKDVVTRGNRTQKKVIAQQVESVYPQAVSRSTEVVPDIYQRATQKDGWVTLATDLKVGDRVRLIGEKEEGVHEVLEISDGAFRTEFVPASEKVFVYGREVKDFRSVDYDAISMLNVSATQELARKVATLETENEALKSRLASLEALAAEVAALKAATQPLLAK